MRWLYYIELHVLIMRFYFSQQCIHIYYIFSFGRAKELYSVHVQSSLVCFRCTILVSPLGSIRTDRCTETHGTLKFARTHGTPPIFKLPMQFNVIL